MSTQKESIFEKALRRLEQSIPEYIKKIGKFQHENDDWIISDWTILPQRTYEICEVCGKEKIREVYYITSLKTNAIKKCGNICIDTITNQKIGRWFRLYQTRKKRIEDNKDAINWIAEILRAYREGGLTKLKVRTSRIGIKRLEKMLTRLCMGQNITEKQQGLVDYYTRKILRAHAEWEKRTAFAL